MPSDADMARIVTEYVHGSDHPDLVVYRKDFETKFDVRRWVREIRRRCELGAFHRKRVLEVGCGFGWDSVGLCLAGDNEIVAVDILPSMIDGLRECLAAMAAKGHDLEVQPVVGDICSLDLPDASFDGIHSSEAIEHVHDLDAMFRRCWQLLVPGGRLLIVDDSNRYNSAFREATFRMWKERDESWEHARWLREEVRPVEHRAAQPYAAMREAIIRNAAPTLDDSSVSRLVAATAGMARDGLLAATSGFVAHATLPTRPAYSWCRNPETGEYAERLLDPFALRESLREHGFQDVELRHGFSRFPLKLLNGIAWRRLNEFLFDRRPQFYLLAAKPA